MTEDELNDSDMMNEPLRDPEDVPDTCEILDCDDPIESFVDEYPVHPDVEFDADRRNPVMCDVHHAAARVMAMTRPLPPYVDVGLYKEVAYYSRALSAGAFGLQPMEYIESPQQNNES